MSVGNSLVGIKRNKEFCGVCQLRIEHTRKFLQGDRLFFLTTCRRIEIEVFVDNHSCHSLDRRLFLALRKQYLDGIRRHHCARDHEEDEQQKDDVGHGRHIKCRGDLCTSLKHRLLLFFANNVHKCERLRFNLIHHAIHFCHKIVVGEQSDNTHNQSTHSRDHCLVNATRKNTDINIATSIAHLPESLHHTNHSAQETYHGSSTSNGCQHRQTLFHGCNLQIARILYGCLDFCRRLAHTADSTLNHASRGSIGDTAEIDG